MGSMKESQRYANKRTLGLPGDYIYQRIL